MGLNVGPIDLLNHFPASWQNELEPLFNGNALKLKTLNRQLFINVKLWAMCDRERDFEDLKAMAPTVIELEKAVEWVTPLDAAEGWTKHVRDTAARLSKSNS